MKLRTLDVGNNFIEVLENVSHLSSLEELWVRKFDISELKPLLSPQLLDQ